MIFSMWDTVLIGTQISITKLCRADNIFYVHLRRIVT